MKKITNYITLLLIATAFLAAKTGRAQTCNPTFVDSVGPNGLVSFYGFAPGSATGGTFSWIFPPSYNWVTGQNVSNTFTANGYYAVTLLWTNAAMTCSGTSQQTIQVTTAPTPTCTLGANISYSQGSNGSVIFTNASTNMASGATAVWQFGDNGTSTSISTVAHTYSANGTYTVKLYVSNNTTPSCADSIAIPITIGSLCSLSISPGFSYTQDNEGHAFFSNTSTGTDSQATYSWHFGDGYSGTGGTAQKSYNIAGGNTTNNYSVTLIVNDGSCIDSTIQTISVTNTCVANASFSLYPTGTPQIWDAVVQNTANVAIAQWSWGDGTTSDSLFTSHTYSAAGTYSICLTVTVACGTGMMDTYCAPYLIYRGQNDQTVIRVNVVDHLSVTTGIQNQSAGQISWAVSPNPSYGSFNLNVNGLSNKTVTVNIYNLLGKQIYSSENETNAGNLNRNIQLNDAAEGVYLLKINDSSSIYTHKIVVGKQ